MFIFRSTGVLFALILTLQLSVQAELQFYGYRKSITHQQDTIFSLTKIGDVTLETSEITVIPKGGYLDITEDAWISGNFTAAKFPDNMGHYLFKGFLPFPEKAAVTGVQTWRNGTLYRGSLYPTEYVFDDYFLDSLVLENILNEQVIHLQMPADNVYEATFAKTELGELKHIRVRYMLPNMAGGRAVYTIPVLFHHSKTASPAFVKFNFIGDSGDFRHKLKVSTGEVELNDNSTVMVQYQPLLQVVSAESPFSTFHATTFPRGPWEGTYIRFNTSLPDTVIKQLSHPMEAVFIWRWNTTHQFISYQDGMKALSSEGIACIEQAVKIRSAMEILSRRGHRLGLYHSIEGKNSRFFPPSLDGSDNLTNALEYLEKFDELYLFNNYGAELEGAPVWKPIEVGRQSSIEDSRDLFRNIVEEVAASFTPSEIRKKHIVLMSLGTILDTRNTILPYKTDSLFSKVTIDASQARWFGIDLVRDIPSPQAQALTSWNGINFPYFQPATIKARIFNRDQPFAFPLSPDTNRTFNISIKSESEWEKRIEWIGMDPDGREVNSIETVPLVFRADMDSGLAKIWASDGERVYEKPEVSLGGKYGILSKASYFKAGIGDSLFGEGEGVAFLNRDEILIPLAVPEIARSKSQPVQMLYIGGILRISFMTEEEDGWLSFFSLNGRLLLKLRLQPYFTGKGSFVVPVGSLLGGRSVSQIVAVIQSGRVSCSRTLTLGGSK